MIINNKRLHLVLPYANNIILSAHLSLKSFNSNSLAENIFKIISNTEKFFTSYLENLKTV